MDTLTQEQEAILKDVYSYHEEVELTEKEIKMVIEMFDVPEKFVILRKMLQVFTHAERGIVVPNSNAVIDLHPENLQTYGLKVAVESLADEKLRQSLANFYTKVQMMKVREKRADFEKENLEKAQEDALREEKNTEDKKAKQTFGENL